jgi:hypothetical protein
MLRLLLISMCFLWMSHSVVAQVNQPPGSNNQNRQQDTTGLVEVDKKLERAKRELQLWREELLGLHSPNKAALYSAALPGLGQIYNDKYWKLPIIGGAAVVTGYFINFNNRRYLLFRRSYFAEIDDDPETVNLVPRFNAEGLQRNLDYFRRNRDLLFITAGIIYLLNIVDAHVDAHLYSFDISEDVTFNSKPTFMTLPNGMPVVGISLSLRL